MRLVDALRLQQGEVVAFIGAGGKSSAIRALSKELSTEVPVLITTTTKLGLDQVDLAQHHYIVNDGIDRGKISELLEIHPSILVTSVEESVEPKWTGLDLEQVQLLVNIAKDLGAILLVEADGARGRSLKAPAEYEPVLPDKCDLVVPVLGLDILGEPINSPLIHRPELVDKLLELDDGETISDEHVVRLIASKQGALKGIPESTEVRVLLNKAESVATLEAGKKIAAGLIKETNIRSVVLTSVQSKDPVHACIGRIAGVVLAAGTSSRMEGLKQLIQFQGKPLVVHAVEAACEAGLDPVVVVTGESKEELAEALQGHPVRVVQNPHPERGQSSSIHVGLGSIQNGAEGVVFLLADMPLVTSDLVKALVSRHRHTLAPIVLPIFEGRRGNPALFDRHTFTALLGVEGDQGGRAVFSRFHKEHVEWDDTIHFDIDSEEDLANLMQLE